MFFFETYSLSTTQLNVVFFPAVQENFITHKRVCMYTQNKLIFHQMLPLYIDKQEKYILIVQYLYIVF